MLKVSVNNYARPEDPGAAQFNTLFTKRGFAGRVGELPEKPKTTGLGAPPAGKVWVTRTKDGSIGAINKSDLQKALDSGNFTEAK